MQGPSTVKLFAIASNFFARDDKALRTDGTNMTIALASMALEMPEVKGHPNRVGFRGVLTVVDAPSQRAPSGARGRRVILPRMVAEAALPSLLGMALDYAPSFDRHDVRRKVGVITSADVIGRNLEVGGYLYARDFPEIVEEIAKEGKQVGKAAIPTSRVQNREKDLAAGKSHVGLGTKEPESCRAAFAGGGGGEDCGR